MLIFLSLIRLTAVNSHVIQHNNHAKLPVKHAVFLFFGALAQLVPKNLRQSRLVFRASSKIIRN